VAPTAWRDHLERVERVALLDVVPTLYRFETIDQKAATSRLALILSDATPADQRRAGQTPNDARPILSFRPRTNSLLFDCSGIQIRWSAENFRWSEA
jgi:hypothetical protein